MNMLGAVAKGMFGKGGGLKVPTEEEEIEDLLNRVAEGGIAEDRREALSQLRDITIDNPKAQLALGGMGMPILVEILREEREDVELVKGAVECLHAAIVRPSDDDAKLQGKEPAAWMINAEMFMRGKDNIALLLTLLEDEPVGISDFYVRYHALQLLGSLMQANPYKLQEAFMQSRTGLSKLMSLLSDNEVLRNETILLLQRLAHGHEEIQKIVAFEGGFERLFSIIGEEGSVEGGVVVQDCWDLLSSLLLNNNKTQLMFREMGFLTNLANFLKSPLYNSSPAPAARQKVLNVCAALNCVRVLLARRSAKGSAGGSEADSEAEQNRVANQALLAKEGAMDSLLVLGMNDEGLSSFSMVRALAVQCLASLITSSRPNQDKLGASRVPTSAAGDDGPPAVQAVLRTALNASSAQERVPACQLLHAFCADNPEGHAALASTLTPLNDLHPGTSGSSFGEELLSALLSADVATSGRAAAVVTLLIDGLTDAKQRLLSVTVGPGRSPDNLLSHTVKQLQAALTTPGVDARVAAVEILHLMICWCSNTPPAVNAFLESHSHVPFTVDVIKGRVGVEDPLISGLAAILLAVLVKCDTPLPPGSAPPAFTPASVLDVITSRVGISEYFGRLDALLADPMVDTSANQTGKDGKDGSWSITGAPSYDDSASGSSEDQPTPFDDSFLDLLHSTASWVRTKAMSAYTRPYRVTQEATAVQLTGASDAEQLQSAIQLITSLQKELMEVTARSSALAQDVLQLSSTGQATDSSSKGEAAGPRSSTPTTMSTSYDSSALAAAEVRAGQAEAQLALMQKEKDSLHMQLASLKADASACRQQADLSRSEAQKYQADLEDLSSAYTSLETHAFQLESQMHEANQKLRETEKKLQEAAASRAAAGGVSEQEVLRRISEAVEAAKREADEDNDDSLNDLLVCLGQEEQKVERLRHRLEELGEDVEKLLEGIGGEADEDAEEEEEKGKEKAKQ